MTIERADAVESKGQQREERTGGLTVAARTHVQAQHRSFDTQRGSAHLDPTGQPGKHAAQRARQRPGHGSRESRILNSTRTCCRSSKASVT